MKYILDSNTFITPYRTYYNFQFGTKFWDFLLEKAKQGIVASIDKVRDELMNGNDELKNWAITKFAPYFLNTKTDAVFEKYAILARWTDEQRGTYNDSAIKEFLNERNADTWLVAFALTNPQEYTIVTFEKENLHIKRKIPIPNACVAHNIGYVDLFQMLKNLDFKL